MVLLKQDRLWLSMKWFITAPTTDLRLVIEVEQVLIEDKHLLLHYVVLLLWDTRIISVTDLLSLRLRLLETLLLPFRALPLST